MGIRFSVNKNNSNSWMDTFLDGFVLNVQLPQEVIESLFFEADLQQLLTFRLVCKSWNEIIESKYFWLNYLKRRSLLDSIPSDLFTRKNYVPLLISLCKNNGFKDNILLNGSLDDGFSNWTIGGFGPSFIRLERPPVGSDPLPDGLTNCFSTSYQRVTIEQLREFHINPNIMQVLIPFTIDCSMLVASRFDCGGNGDLRICFGRGKSIKSKHKEIHKQEGDTKWTKAELSMLVKSLNTPLSDRKPFIVKTIISGRDTKFWAGHYGIKFTGIEVKIKLRSKDFVPEISSAPESDDDWGNIRPSPNHFLGRYIYNDNDEEQDEMDSD